MTERTRDGKAAAGPLAELLTIELTTLMMTCASCGSPAPLGTLGADAGMSKTEVSPI